MSTEYNRGDPFDSRRPTAVAGLIGAFVDAGVLASADVHVSATLARLTKETDESLLLAAALAVRATRLGAVCLDLRTVPETISREANGLHSSDGAEPRDALGATGDPARALPWPEFDSWQRALVASAMVSTSESEASDTTAAVLAAQPIASLRYVDGLLYLDRYWDQQATVLRELNARRQAQPPTVNGPKLASTLDDLFGADSAEAAAHIDTETPGAHTDADAGAIAAAAGTSADPGTAMQRQAVATALTGWFSIISGGPGTGKTTTVARLIAAAQKLGQPKIALAAPTGKAAARLGEAVSSELADLRQSTSHPSHHESALGQPPSVTLHRLLGWRPGGTYRYHAGNRLPLDLVVVDEASMVSLTMMSRLLQALRPEAILVLVGDPDQLASVEAGAVLGDLVARADLADRVVRLTHNYRNSPAIAALAEVIRLGDADAAVTVLQQAALAAGTPGATRAIEFIDTVSTELAGSSPSGADTLRSLQDDVVAAAGDSIAAAQNSDVTQALLASSRHRLLCAHRNGPYGVQSWSRTVDAWVSQGIEGLRGHGEWYIGRPLLVDVNDYDNDLFNGDTGIVVTAQARGVEGLAGGLVGAFDRGGTHVEVSVARLGAVQTLHAMTVHRAQGSQAQAITIILPPADSPLLTRELLYTAVTRAQERVRIVGTEASVRAAIGRRIQRPSGLSRQTVTGQSGTSSTGTRETGMREPGTS